MSGPHDRDPTISSPRQSPELPEGERGGREFSLVDRLANDTKPASTAESRPKRMHAAVPTSNTATAWFVLSSRSFLTEIAEVNGHTFVNVLKASSRGLR